MDRYQTGMLAKSKAGHDTGKVYVIMDIDDTYVYLADGRIRTLDKLKRKKKKHVQIICKKYDVTAIDGSSFAFLRKNMWFYIRIKWDSGMEQRQVCLCLLMKTDAA